jgi:hypothetical protein
MCNHGRIRGMDSQEAYFDKPELRRQEVVLRRRRPPNPWWVTFGACAATAVMIAVWWRLG